MSFLPSASIKQHNHLPPTDMRVMVNKGVMFRLHKHIFTAASAEFQNLVNQTYERFGDQVSVFVRIDPDVFRVIYKFLYLKQLDHESIKIENMDQALALMDATELYKIELLEPQVMKKVKDLMTPHNAFKVLEFTRRMTQVSQKFSDLEKDALDMICQNQETRINSEST